MKEKFRKRYIHDAISPYYNLPTAPLFVRYGFVFKDTDPTFNAGVYGVNFDLWRSRDLHKEVQYWLEEVYTLRLGILVTMPFALHFLCWKCLSRHWMGYPYS